jgi:hypothetical protein
LRPKIVERIAELTGGTELLLALRAGLAPPEQQLRTHRRAATFARSSIEWCR